MAVQYFGNKNADGSSFGQAITDLISLYGAAPVAQPAATAQSTISPATITDGSTGTAAATNGIAALTGTYNSTLLINAIATLAERSNANTALLLAIRTALLSVGIMKGSA